MSKDEKELDNLSQNNLQIGMRSGKDVVKCPSCQGIGTIFRGPLTTHGFILIPAVKCRGCDGNGYVATKNGKQLRMWIPTLTQYERTNPHDYVMISTEVNTRSTQTSSSNERRESPKSMPVPPPQTSYRKRALFVSIALLLLFLSSIGIWLGKIPSDTAAFSAATATFVAVHFPFSLTQVLYDPLFGSNSYWAREKGCDFNQSGAYEVNETQRGTALMCTRYEKAFDDPGYLGTNSSYEVTLKSLQGNTANRAGLVFGYNSHSEGNASGYIFAVSPSGQYRVEKCSSFLFVSRGCDELAQGELPIAFSLPMRLGVTVASEACAVYVNGQAVTQLNDTENFPYTGGIGVAVVNIDGQITADFGDARVWKQTNWNPASH